MGNLPRLFRLIRDVDVSDVSGTGHVADVVVFSDGEAAVHFLGKWPTTTPHPGGLKAVEEIHGHEGRTRIVPLDADKASDTAELRQRYAETLAGHAGSKAFLSDDPAYAHIREVWFGYADALIKNVPVPTPAVEGETHYITGGAVTQCCGMSPFELPRTDRITGNLADMTCAGSGIRRYIWPIDKLNPATGKPWARCEVHPECPVIGTCHKCEEQA